MPGIARMMKRNTDEIRFMPADSSKTPLLLQRERLEHVGRSDGEAEARVEGRHAENDSGVHAHGTPRDAAPDPDCGAALGARRRHAAARAGAAVDLAYHLDSFPDGASDRRAVVEHVVLVH